MVVTAKMMLSVPAKAGHGPSGGRRETAPLGHCALSTASMLLLRGSLRHLPLLLLLLLLAQQFYLQPLQLLHGDCCEHGPR